MQDAALSLRVAYTETLEGLEALSGEWRALEARTPEATGFQSYDWCRCWLFAARERGAPSHVRVVSVREGGRLVMLWPLRIDRFLGATVVGSLGHPMTQYGDALAEPGPGRVRWLAVAQEEFARWREVDLFAFTRLRGDSVLVDAGLPTLRGGEALEAPFVDLRDGVQKRHKSLERRIRKLAQFGETVFEEVAEPQERIEAVREALRLKRKWLRSKGFYSAGLHNPVTAGFVEELARSGFLRVNRLIVGGRTAAVDIGFVSGSSYRSFLGCFDERFSQGSPGQALTARMLERSVANGLHTFDFLSPADAYKLTWTARTTPLFISFRAVSLRGRLVGFVLDSVRARVKWLMAQRAAQKRAAQ